MAAKNNETKAQTKRGKINERVGLVVNNKAAKTISVEITRVVRHERYGKFLKTHRKFLAHDEKNEAQIGDKVLIVETRPLSNSKRWKLVKVLVKGEQEVGGAQ